MVREAVLDEVGDSRWRLSVLLMALCVGVAEENEMTKWQFVIDSLQGVTLILLALAVADLRKRMDRVERKRRTSFSDPIERDHK